MSEDPVVANARRVVPQIAGGRLEGVATLRGDASSRRYHRLTVGGGQVASLIVMELPSLAGSDEVSKGAAPPRLPFVDVLVFLREGGLPVPALHLYDEAAGLIYLEDLGDTTLESLVVDAPPVERLPRYRASVHLLAELQRHGESRAAGCVAYERRFDFDLLRWELDHFREWLLETDRNVRLAGADAATLAQEFDHIARALADGPTTFVHRDFQSRNLMVQGERLRLIDFQDALIGPLPYDLVGLLRDSYVVLAADEVDALIEAYLAERPFAGGVGAFRRWFDLQTVQRKLKDAGRFIYIDRVKKNPSFLPYVRDSLLYVRQALDRLPAWVRLREVLWAHLPEFADSPMRRVVDDSANGA